MGNERGHVQVRRSEDHMLFSCALANQMPPIQFIQTDMCQARNGTGLHWTTVGWTDQSTVRQTTTRETAATLPPLSAIHTSWVHTFPRSSAKGWHSQVSKGGQGR